MFFFEERHEYSKRTQQPSEPSVKASSIKDEENEDFADVKARKRKVSAIKRVRRKEDPLSVETPQREDLRDEESDGEDDTLSDLDNAEPKVEQREAEVMLS